MNNGRFSPIRRIIRRALEEDLGPGDATTRATVSPDTPGEAILIAREKLILAGMAVFKQTFLEIDPTLVFSERYRDGDVVPEGSTVCRIRGCLAAILSGERTALNFLQRMSGIATLAVLKTIPWKRILPILAVAAIIGLIWWRVDAHFDHVADLETKVTEQVGVIKDLKEGIAKRDAAEETRNKAVEAAHAERDATEAKYQELLARPPAEIVRWRERAAGVPTEITGPTCTDALLQGHTIVTETAGWPGGGQ